MGDFATPHFSADLPPNVWNKIYINYQFRFRVCLKYLELPLDRAVSHYHFSEQIWIIVPIKSVYHLDALFLTGRSELLILTWTMYKGTILKGIYGKIRGRGTMLRTSGVKFRHYIIEVP